MKNLFLVLVVVVCSLVLSLRAQVLPELPDDDDIYDFGGVKCRCSIVGQPGCWADGWGSRCITSSNCDSYHARCKGGGGL